MLPFSKISEGWRSLEREVEPLLLLDFLDLGPRGNGLLDFLRPLNLPAALVAIFGLEKNLLFAILAEEALLLLKLRGHSNL
jgi:hypothetical protein